MQADHWGKTYPPRLDPETSLLRDRLIDTILKRWSRRKILLIQAQAGQGKSLFTAQMMHRAELPFCWYQVGPEDGDPVAFLSTLYGALRRNLSDFAFPLLDRMLDQGEVSALETPRLAHLLGGALKDFLRLDFCLVLDDLHLLENSPFSLGLLNSLMQSAPPCFCFVIISRRPVAGFEPPCEPLVVRNADLAFSRNDIADLFTRKPYLGLTTRQVRELHRITEGWVMGLLMLGATLASGRRETDLTGLKPDEVLDFFFHEVLGEFPRSWRRTLLKLSLLEEIPMDLTRQAAEEEGADADLLKELEHRNFFVRRLDDSAGAFVFHHLFRDSLRALAESELSERERRDQLRLAGKWCWEKQRVEEALTFYARAADFQMVEHILCQVGLDLRAANRIVTLRDVLERVPEEAIRSHPCLCYFAGIAFQEFAPEKALVLLERACSLFSREKNDIWELFTVVDLISYHFIIDGAFQKGRAILSRADELFNRVKNQLPQQTQFIIAAAISNGFSVFYTNIDKSREYDSFLLKLRVDNVNHLSIQKSNRCFSNLFAGDLSEFKLTIEEFYPYLNDHRTNIINQMFMMVTIINNLAIEADAINFFNYKNMISSRFDSKIIENSVASVAIRAFELEILVDSGFQFLDTSEIEILLKNEWLNVNAKGGMLQYLAYIKALQGNSSFLPIAEKSIEIHAVYSSPFYQAYNEMMLGGAYAQMGLRKEAEPLLQSAIDRSEQIGEEFLRCAAYAHRAFLHLKLDGPEAALEDLGRCLEIMRRNRYPRFLSWCPQLMKPLLPLAVAHGIESDYARKLAAERLDMAILPDGGTLPLLHFHTLGGFEARFGEDLVLKGADLSTIQRRLISLLLSSPHLQIPQEELQAILWPESPAGKSRSKFDTLLSRLRSTLDKHLAPHSSRHFLSLAKGVLRLENCRIDAREFQSMAQKGVQHARRKEPWQAGNAFRNAFHQWKGTFLPQTLLDDPPLRFREELESLAIEGAMAWHSILEKENRSHEAESILTLALRLDRTNDALVRSLHRLHMEKGKPKRAAQVLRDYSRALAHEEYTEEEIRDILTEISADCDGR